MDLQNVLDRLKESINKQDNQNTYKCNLCKDKEFLEIQEEDGLTYFKKCDCLKKKQSYERLEFSGLKNIINNNTFEKYIVKNIYQKNIKNLGIKFINQTEIKGFFIGGQVGVGKTHICTAICKNYIDKGLMVRYYMYRDMISELKGNILDFETYKKILDPIKNTNVLYIDDLFKTKAGNFDILKTDIEHLFPIINERYINKKITIISSEKTLDEIIQIDEGIGSRIKQMCTGKEAEFSLNISKDSNKNFRLNG